MSFLVSGASFLGLEAAKLVTRGHKRSRAFFKLGGLRFQDLGGLSFLDLGGSEFLGLRSEFSRSGFSRHPP